MTGPWPPPRFFKVTVVRARVAEPDAGRLHGWLGLSWSQLGWVLRLIELPAVLVLVLLGRPGSDPFVLLGLLAVTSGCWIAWLVIRPGRCEVPGGGATATVLMLMIAVSSGCAAMVPGAGNAAVLTGIVAVHAGAGLRVPTAVAVPAAGAAGVLAGMALFTPTPAPVLLGFYAAVFAGATLAGVVRGLKRVQFGQTQMLLVRERAARAGQENAAALAERARIAREIHDVLAHALADLCIQLEVADALLTDGADVATAVGQVRRAHRLADDGLRETRNAVYALRSDTPPLPDALAVMAAARDQAVFLLQGSPRPLSAAAGLALVRTAQEALVNAGKYAAGAPITLRLTYTGDRVHLIVTDALDRSPRGRPSRPEELDTRQEGGYGLAGMRERLQLLGGCLTAGPVPGGWTVHAQVPA